MGAAHIARERGEREETARLYGEALALVRQAVREGLDNRAVRVAMVVTLRELGHLSERTGNGDNARSYQEESLAWARRIGEPRLLARTLEGLAGALSLGGRPVRPRDCSVLPRPHVTRFTPDFPRASGTS